MCGGSQKGANPVRQICLLVRISERTWYHTAVITTASAHRVLGRGDRFSQIDVSRLRLHIPLQKRHKNDQKKYKNNKKTAKKQQKTTQKQHKSIQTHTHKKLRQKEKAHETLAVEEVEAEID